MQKDPSVRADQDLTNVQFGRWTIIRLDSGAGWRSQWLCRCQCGKEKVVAWRSLRSGDSQSCGCLQKEKASEQGKIIGPKNKKHGMYYSPEWIVWQGIRARCFNPNSPNFKNYGGIGITVCERWRHSFEAFFEDMGTRPSPRHTIDRFPNGKGDYEPGNCRWATDKEQQRNKKNVVFVEFQGERRCLAELCELYGLHKNTVKRRLNKGWTLEAALSTPPLPRGHDRLNPSPFKGI